MQDATPMIPASLLSRMPAVWKWILAACAWTAAIALCLEFGKLRSSWSGVLCGPWGCSAPLEAVLSIHAIWLLTLFPTVYWTSRGRTRVTLGWCVLSAGAGIGGAVFLGVRLWQQMPAEQPGGLPAYFFQQWGLAIFGAVDFPIVPSLLLLPFCLFQRWRRKPRSADS